MKIYNSLNRLEKLFKNIDKKLMTMDKKLDKRIIRNKKDSGYDQIMRFTYTKHVVKKMKFLEQLGITISKIMIEEAVNNPLDLDMETDKPRIIASAKLNSDHILRDV